MFSSMLQLKMIFIREKEWFLCHYFDCKKRCQSYAVLHQNLYILVELFKFYHFIYFLFVQVGAAKRKNILKYKYNCIEIVPLLCLVFFPLFRREITEVWSKFKISWATKKSCWFRPRISHYYKFLVLFSKKSSLFFVV